MSDHIHFTASERLERKGGRVSEGRFFLNVPQDRTHYLALIYIAAQQMLGTQGMRGTSVEAQYFEIMQRAEHEYLLRGGDPRNLCGL